MNDESRQWADKLLNDVRLKDMGMLWGFDNAPWRISAKGG